MCDFIFVPIFCGTWDHVRSLGPELVRCPRCHNTTIQSIRRRTWMTLYCVPVVPISRRRTLYHCDICRWEGIPVARVRVNNEERRPQRNMSNSSDLYIPESTATPGNGQPVSRETNGSGFQAVPYSQDEYQQPPPPYSEAAPQQRAKNGNKSGASSSANN
ncbi:hypothetical protein GGI25_002311 [Coemansia spiralis]|uniref:Zinc-ribbon 15 domain-containing protein n=2 Tax=Coemansia TaxID=4863 RepID=A0A9W8GAW6_9FUNG|nr:hypothetical protein BX070DRAFT_219725 [Coemansia spiralis]KAJ1995298.1 hypothetical protein EDC05_001136 [Coemansia umbellata]KAJ2625699.1 hypothetical protein GGI26_000499 [Coemansia sp. RSA 1358]KAJ2678517.1 hypothetical protein GGI25_002311 [Coemansia spiralis]